MGGGPERGGSPSWVIGPVALRGADCGRAVCLLPGDASTSSNLLGLAAGDFAVAGRPDVDGTPTFISNEPLRSSTGGLEGDWTGVLPLLPVCTTSIFCTGWCHYRGCASWWYLSKYISYVILNRSTITTITQCGSAPIVLLRTDRMELRWFVLRCL